MRERRGVRFLPGYIRAVQATAFWERTSQYHAWNKCFFSEMITEMIRAMSLHMLPFVLTLHHKLLEPTVMTEAESCCTWRSAFHPLH